MVRSAGGAAVHRPKPYARALLEENRRRYERLVDMVGRYAERGDGERVLRATVLAANFAWCAPVGLLSDLRLERAVVRSARGSGVVSIDGRRRTGRILHVLSEAYVIGGHTRQVCAWMAHDERISDVVLTNQRQQVPARLAEAVTSSGGQLHDLTSTGGGLLGRARALRELMDRADLVVLTVHPWDAVSLAAVNLPGVRPPVLYANHADHSFWLGVGGADLVLDWRAHARGLDVAMRGVPEARVGLLPLPMEPLPPVAGSALRGELGIRPDATVAVTVSADWKVAPAFGRGMHDVVDRILQWSPTLAVVLVGISPSEDWARVAKRYPGRVFPVGSVPHPAPYLGIADIYLESYPLLAGTTPLEAAMAGLPVLALTDLPEDDAAYIFHTGSPGLDARPACTSAGQFAVTVRRLVQDAGLRRQEGDAIRAAVEAVHAGAGWTTQLESIYERARALTAVDVDDLTTCSPNDRYNLMLLSTTSPVSPDPGLLAAPLGDLFDETMQADLFAALQRDAGPSLHLRVASHWERHEEWTTRLLQLAAAHRRLRVSLPFVADDDVEGSQTTASVVDLLARLGQTSEDCGDINIETRGPRDAVPGISGELPFSVEALDWLERLLVSPCWRPLDPDALVGPEVTSVGAA